MYATLSASRRKRSDTDAVPSSLAGRTGSQDALGLVALRRDRMIAHMRPSDRVAQARHLICNADSASSTKRRRRAPPRQVRPFRGRLAPNTI
jgi:hypothetical protein